MGKIILKTYFETKTDSFIKNNIRGIEKENQLLFKEDDYTVNICKIENTINMIRENLQNKIKFSFKNNEKSNIEYNIKDFNTILIPIVTKKCQMDNKKIDIIYKIIDTDLEVHYKIDYKKWEDKNEFEIRDSKMAKKIT